MFTTCIRLNDHYFDPLPMVYRLPYPWYFDPPIHGISTPLSMVYQPPYPWYIDPSTHGISTPLPMIYRPLIPWYIDRPAHVISTPLPMVYQTLSYGIMNSSLLVEMRGIQFTMRGFKIQ